MKEKEKTKDKFWNVLYLPSPCWYLSVRNHWLNVGVYRPACVFLESRHIPDQELLLHLAFRQENTRHCLLPVGQKSAPTEASGQDLFCYSKSTKKPQKENKRENFYVTHESEYRGWLSFSGIKSHINTVFPDLMWSLHKSWDTPDFVTLGDSLSEEQCRYVEWLMGWRMKRKTFCQILGKLSDRRAHTCAHICRYMQAWRQWDLCSPIAHGGCHSTVCLDHVARREGEEQMCLFSLMQPH